MFLLQPRSPARFAARDERRVIAGGAELRAHEWKYVAEGGANVLFRHIGRESAFQGKLLRVKKCDVVAATKKKKKKKVGGYVPHYPHPRQVLEYATEDVMPYMARQLGDSAVSWTPPRPLIGADGGQDTATDEGFSSSTAASSGKHNVYVQVAELLEVDRVFLVELNEMLLNLDARPVHRRQSQIDVSLQCVMVLPDVTLPPPDDDNQLLFEDVADIVVVDDKDRVIHEEDEREVDEDDSATDQTDEDDTEAENEAELRVPLDAEAHSSGSTSTATSDDEAEAEGESSASVAASVASALPPHALARLASGASTASARHLLRRGISDSFRNGSIFDCCFRNVCVELKPKIGFMPRGSLIPAIKTRVCRFCMHQHYKKAAGKVEEISEYCPLDLFSRDAPRIRHALRALQRTPQNNFKVFVRSNQDEVVNVITGMNADALPKGASQARYSYCRRKRMGFRHSCQSIGFEHDLNADEGETDSATYGCCGQDDDDEHPLPDVVELLTQVLLQLDILEDLKRLQMLDHISVDGIWHVQRLLRTLEEAAASDAGRGGGQDVSLDTLVNALRAQSEAAAFDGDINEEGSLARCLAFLQSAIEEVDDLQSVVNGAKEWRQLSLAQLTDFYSHLEQRFQVATTLKDCSLLLCLRRSTEDEKPGSAASPSRRKDKEFDHLIEYEHPVAFRHLVFNCVVAIVDLDVKSHKSVDDYYRLDDKIVKHYTRFVAADCEGGAACCCEVRANPSSGRPQ